MPTPSPSTQPASPSPPAPSAALAAASRARRIRVLAFLPYTVVGVVYLVGQFAGVDEIPRLLKPGLMPVLLLGMLAALPWALPERRQVTLGVAAWGGLAIVASWLGDTSLMYSGDVGFLTGLGFFLLAHVFYLVLLLRHLRLRRIPFASLAYVGWLIALIALLAPHTGWLIWPLLAYGLVLGGMAAIATAAGPWVAVGAGLFLVSDSILGINRFMPGFEIWQVDFVIMITYIAAQGLIAWGAIRRARGHKGSGRLTQLP